MNNSQARKWQLTLNNPNESGFSRDVLIETLMKFFPDYYCMADEIGKSGTPHTHIFIFSHSPIRFNTLKNRLPTAHIERAFGTVKENRDYISKSGKWANDEKAETSVKDSFYEYGEMPTEKSEKSPGMTTLIENLKSGMRTAQIVDDTPNLAFKIKDIDILRQTLLSERYTTENRNLHVTYLYGKSGAGKTRSIFQAHDPRDVCRITSYRAGKGVFFDAYNGQDVLVFEEFHAQIPIEEMLNYLDIYPIYLPARYSDRIACFTKIYITSNLPLSEQYKNIQKHQPETWNAFLRRIHSVTEYRHDGTIIKHLE
jgi:hypothetical protein